VTLSLVAPKEESPEEMRFSFVAFALRAQLERWLEAIG